MIASATCGTADDSTKVARFIEGLIGTIKDCFFSLAKTRIAIQITTAKPDMIRLLMTTVLAAVLTDVHQQFKQTYTETKQNEKKKKEQAATTQL